MNGYKCECCKEVFNYRDEMTFLAGDVIVVVNEQCPDWSTAFCNECADNNGLI